MVLSVVLTPLLLADLRGWSGREGIALLERRWPEKAVSGAVALLARFEGARFATFAQEDAVEICGR